MTSGDMTILEAAFDRAIGLDDSARATFLAEFARQHPGLVAKLAALLAADTSATDFGSPIAHSMERLIEESAEGVIGYEFGPWKAIGTVGFGGMGAVYLVERSDGSYAQTAALKLMKPHLSARDLASRFLRERQILASLNHAGIAQLLDGGSTEDGDPWLVMELVEGDRIDTYCQEHGLGLAARLELVRQTCEAVDYAHRNLVIHRDLKPSNILVTPAGQVKILDFGIAKLLEPEDAPPDMTLAERRVLTPDFASPEQVRGERVTVATDVYSLGVLLHRLLTGKSPYATTSDSTPFEIERAVLDDEPSRPSTVVLSASQDAGPKSLPLAPDQLRRKLRGDLDNIILKCLQKEPERRYGGARALADDLERYLTGRPVEARGDAWTYRARKFIGRNVIGVAATAAVFMGATGFAIYHTNRLAAERDRAELAAQRSLQVASFLEDVFRSSDPNEAQGTDVSAIELLDRALVKIEGLNHQPLLQARLLGIIGNTFRARGQERRGRDLIERAIRIHRQASTGLVHEDLALAEMMSDLSEAYRLSDDPAKAQEISAQVLAMREALLPPDDAAIAATLTRMGVISFDLRDREGGLDYLQRAMAIQRRAERMDAPESIDTLGNIGITLDSLGRYEEAEPALREATQRSDAVEGKLAPNSIIRLGNLGLLLLRTYRFAEAVPVLGEAARRAKAVFPPENPQIGFAVSNYATALRGLGRMPESREANLEAASLTRVASGEYSLDYAARLRGLGSFYSEMGEFSLANQNFRQALTITRSAGGPDHHYIAQIEALQGRLLRRIGRPEAAEQLLRKALRSADSLNSSRTLSAQGELAAAISEQGRLAEAGPLFAQTLSRREQLVGTQSPVLIPLLLDLSAHYSRTGEAGNAIQTARRAMQIGEDALPPENWLTALAMARYALALKQAGQRERAVRMARRARAVLVATFGTKDPRVTALHSLY